MKYCRRPGLNEKEQKQLDEGVDFRVSRESVERMNDYLFDEINKLVGEDDELYHVGDFCFGAKYDYYKTVKRFRDRINCRRVHQIFGNHDFYDDMPSIFETNGHRAFTTYNNQFFVFDHYCGAIWNKHHHKAILCYAHSHSTAERWADKIMPGRRSMDIGVDNAAKLLGAYRPFALEEVIDILKDRPGHTTGDHHQ